MTSAVRIRSKAAARPGRRAGMTLLEVVIALSLVVILLGLGVVKYGNGADERAIREAVARIEAMSSRGHAMAILHKKPFWLRLEPGRVVLAGSDTKRGSTIFSEEGVEKPDLSWGEDEEESNEVIYDTFSSDVLVGLRRWGAKADAWQMPNEDQNITWSYQSSGLCEPVAFRLEIGESWVVMHMHPLTARIEEEEMEIR